MTPDLSADGPDPGLWVEAVHTIDARPGRNGMTVTGLSVVTTLTRIGGSIVIVPSIPTILIVVNHHPGIQCSSNP